MKYIGLKLLANRIHFDKKVFIAHFLVLLLGIGLILMDVLLMIFSYKRIVVSSLIICITFAIVVIVCSIQLLLYFLCNKAKEETLFYDAKEKKIYFIPIIGKDKEINIDDVLSIDAKKSFNTLFGKNQTYGKIYIYLKNKQIITLSYIENALDCKDEICQTLKINAN